MINNNRNSPLYITYYGHRRHQRECSIGISYTKLALLGVHFNIAVMNYVFIASLKKASKAEHLDSGCRLCCKWDKILRAYAPTEFNHSYSAVMCYFVSAYYKPMFSVFCNHVTYLDFV